MLTGYDDRAISYDSIGNPLSDGKRTYTWEHGRELATVTQDGSTWTNTYGADGLRTKRTDGTTTYRYRYTAGQLATMNIDDDVEMWFMYDDNGPLVIKYGNAESHKVYHYELNLQGDIIAIVSTTGERVVEYTYDAWGNVLSITGSAKDTIGVNNPLRYRGYIYDPETQLYYCQSRYYNPEMGRFLNADAFASTGQGLLGNNMFAYCGNNPVNNSDPSGAAYQGIYSQINYNEHDHMYGGLRENFYALPEETFLRKAEKYVMNEDASAVLEAEYFAFYKGVPVVRTSMDRSGAFGIIFLAKNTNHIAHPEDMLRHEYGHIIQFSQLGAIKYALCIFIPSWQMWGNESYYNKPWEVTADIYGGVQSRNPSQAIIDSGFQYLIQSLLGGPLAWASID